MIMGLLGSTPSNPMIMNAEAKRPARTTWPPGTVTPTTGHPEDQIPQDQAL
jgi:hypothetical protein